MDLKKKGNNLNLVIPPVDFNTHVEIVTGVHNLDLSDSCSEKFSELTWHEMSTEQTPVKKPRTSTPYPCAVFSNFDQVSLIFCSFLVACQRLYKSLCRSVCLLVGLPVCLPH